MSEATVTREQLRAWLADGLTSVIDLGHLDQYADILHRRYCGPERESLASIAASYGRSREIVRQREAKALRLLRHPRRRHLLDADDAAIPDRLYIAIFGELRFEEARGGNPWAREWHGRPAAAPSRDDPP